jgi:hypothetical protein
VGHVFILDSLLIGSLRFVLDKVAAAVDAEMNDDGTLRDQLLAAEMRLELGEIDEQEFAAIEVDLLRRLRELRERREPESPPTLATGEYTVTGVEATVEGDEHG